MQITLAMLLIRWLVEDNLWIKSLLWFMYKVKVSKKYDKHLMA